MAERWSDPTAAGAVYTDPTAPVYIAPLMLTEPDPVYRDDALFASSSGNWRPAPVPPPPLPILNEAGELVVMIAPPTPAELRDQAVAALHAPPAGGPAPVASRGGARSTYAAPVPARGPGGRRPVASRPAGSVTSSPATWLPDTRLPDTRLPDTRLPDTRLPDRSSSAPYVPPPPPPSGRRTPGQRGPWGSNRGTPTGSLGNMPTPTVPWRASPPPPTWQPTPMAAPTRPTSWVSTQSGPGSMTYRAQARAARSGRSGRRSNKGWIPGLIVVALLIVFEVAPHLGDLSLSHHGPPPAGVDQVVNSYYTDLERGDLQQGVQLICSAQRAEWLNDGDNSDLNLDPTGHTITSTASAGHGKYTVDVDIVPAGTPSFTLTVVRENGAYQICGGTGP